MLKYPHIAACIARLIFFSSEKMHKKKMRVHTFSTELHADTPITGSDLFEFPTARQNQGLFKIYAPTAMCMHAQQSRTMHVVFRKRACISMIQTGTISWIYDSTCIAGSMRHVAVQMRVHAQHMWTCKDVVREGIGFLMMWNFEVANLPVWR